MDARLTYLLALALTLGLGAFAVAAELYARYLARLKGRVLDTYAVVLLVAAALGVAALGSDTLGRWSPTLVVASVVGGVALGYLTRRADRAIMRRLSRRRRRETPGRVSDAHSASVGIRAVPTGGALLLGGGDRRDPGSHRSRNDPRQVDPSQFPLVTVLGVAVAEEVFYRGVLLHAALLPGSAWISALLVTASVVAFLLSHVTFGWDHVLAKTPLGLGTTAAVLISGSLLPAVVAHAWFNGTVWRELRSSGGRSR